MLKNLIKKPFKKGCCQRFKKFKQVVTSAFSKVRSLTKKLLRFLRFPIESDATLKLLTARIKQERKGFREKGFTEKLRTILSDTYVPSLKSSVYIAVLVLLVWCIGEIFENLLGIESSFRNITEVHTGIGVVIFALIIFVAESLRDDEAKDKSRVLLKVSYLFPLVMAEIIVFFILLWKRDDGVGEAFIVSVIGIFTIVSLARIIDVLLSKHEFNKQRFNLLQERLRQSIKTALDELLGNKILSSKLGDSNIKLCFSPLLDFEYYAQYRRLIDYSKDYYFEAKKNGIIADVNFSELNEVSTLMSQLEKPKHSDIDEEDKSESYSPYFNSSDQITVNSNAYLMKGFRDVINEQNKQLICIHKDLVDGNPELLKEIETHIDKAFTIKSEGNSGQEVRDEISGINDQFISAIVNKQFDQIDRLSNLYINLADSFSEYMEKYNKTHLKDITKQKLANKVEQSILFSESARDIFNQTIESRDIGIIRKVNTLARIISSRAIEKDNYNLFQEFIRFPEWLYKYAMKEKDEQLKKLLIKLSWEYLASVYSAIDYPRDNGNTGQASHILQKYALDILAIFHILLKRAFDYKDLDSFNEFQKIVKNIFVESVLQELIFSHEQRQEINKRYKQMYFGLASWILKHLLDSESDNEKNPFLNIKDAYFYKSICLLSPSDINTFTTDFLEIWGWNINYGELDYSELDSTYVLGDIQIFYIVNLLFLLKDKDKSSIESIRLPDNLKTQVSHLIDRFNQIKNNPDKYKFVIGKIDSTKIDLLEQRFLSIKSTSSQ